MISQGHVAESEVYSYLVKKGFTVFVTFLEGAPFDFVVWRKDTGLKIIEVKSSDSYRNSIKHGGPRMKTDFNFWNICIQSSSTSGRLPSGGFNSKLVDLLAVYLPTPNKILFFDAKKVKARTKIKIREDHLLSGQYCDNIDELLGC